MTNEQFALNDGRSIGVSAFGDAWARRLVVLCAPSPGSGVFDPDPVTTNTWGLHLIACDRPGYGGSDLMHNGDPITIQGFADDLAQTLRRMESRADAAGRRNEMFPVGLVGWGYGASVALSLAARHSDLVDVAVIVDARSPKELRNEASAVTVEVPGADYAHGVEELASALGATSRTALQWLRIAEDDPALTKLGLRNRLERMANQTESNTMTGFASDIMAAQDTSWGDELSSITAPVTAVFNQQDARRRQNARWLARRIPNARTVGIEGPITLPIVEFWPRILEVVAPNHGGLPLSARSSMNSQS